MESEVEMKVESAEADTQTVNEVLLANVVLWVEEQEKLDVNEREWDQSDWGFVEECNTKCCVAGKIALDAGMHPTYDCMDQRYSLSLISPRPNEVADEESEDQFLCSIFAAGLLGLNSLRASNLLFDMRLTSRDIRAGAERLMGRTVEEVLAEAASQELEVNVGTAQATKGLV